MYIYLVSYPAIGLVNIIKFARLLRQLGAYVAANEDALQVQPLALHQQPFLNDFRDISQCAFPFVDRLQKGANKSVGRQKKLRVKESLTYSLSFTH